VEQAAMNRAHRPGRLLDGVGVATDLVGAGQFGLLVDVDHFEV